jgi:hypothetical protein
VGSNVVFVADQKALCGVDFGRKPEQSPWRMAICRVYSYQFACAELSSTVTNDQLWVLYNDPGLWSCAPGPNDSVALFQYPYPAFRNQLVTPDNMTTHLQCSNILMPLCACFLPANLSRSKAAGICSALYVTSYLT